MPLSRIIALRAAAPLAAVLLAAGLASSASAAPSPPSADVPPADGSGKLLAPTGDPVFDALWAAAVAEADAVDPDVPDDGLLRPDTDTTPFVVDEDERDGFEPELAARAARRSVRPTLRLTGRAGRRRATVTCPTAAGAGGCVGTLRARTRTGSARAWRVHVPAGGRRVVGVPAGTRAVSFAIRAA